MMKTLFGLEEGDWAKLSKFYTGWRPGLGWVAVGGCVMAFVILPATDAIQALAYERNLQPYPVENLIALVTFALGGKFIRHLDKKEGVATLNSHTPANPSIQPSASTAEAAAEAQIETPDADYDREVLGDRI